MRCVLAACNAGNTAAALAGAPPIRRKRKKFSENIRADNAVTALAEFPATQAEKGWCHHCGELNALC